MINERGEKAGVFLKTVGRIVKAGSVIQGKKIIYMTSCIILPINVRVGDKCSGKEGKM